MTGSGSGMRRQLVGMLLGLMILLAGCDGTGAVFDLDPPDNADAPEEQLSEDGGDQDAPDDIDGSEAAPSGDGGAADGDGADGEPSDPDAVAESPFEGTDGLFVPPTQAANWVQANADDPRADVIRERIAQVPSSMWMTGGGDVAGAVDGAVAAAAEDNTVPVLVAYNVPGRDCGQFSAGGANGGDAYRAWVDDFAGAIGDRPAVVIIEPDALAGMDCLSDTNQADRLELLRYAVEQFAASAPNTWTYLDAGHAQWQPADVMAERLDAAGVEAARGFALNVSNYYTTAENQEYGDAVSAALGSDTPYVVDTSRNGNGSNGEWCNPAGRAIGATPAIHELGSGLEMELWIKLPGESDGDCGIGAGTSAGQFVPDIAFELAGG